MTLPALAEPFSLILTRDPLEVRFVYAGLRLIDNTALLGINLLFLLISIVIGYVTYRLRKGAWSASFILQIIIIMIQIAGSIELSYGEQATRFSASIGQIGTILISLAILYLLARKDVRSTLNVAKVSQ